MAEQELKIKRFSGGISSFEKLGPEYSGSDITLDIFQDPSYMTVPRVAVKVSGDSGDGTTSNLVIWGVDGSPFDTNRYFTDLDGKIYQEDSGGTWSTLRTVSGAAGEGLEIFDDYLYYPLATELGRYGKLSGTPAFDDALTSWWDGAISDIQTTGGGTGQTYSTATSIAETATHRQTFTPTHDPIKEITIDINDTGDDPDWTLTVHDSENNLIGSKTIAFADVTTGDNTFTFATPLRVVIGNGYHFHVTTSTTTGAPKVTSNVASDLEGAEFTVEYGVLIDSEFHPTVVVEDKLIIGNEQYLAVFDQATYNPTEILLDRGFKARTITKIDEYIVVGAYKGNSISEAEEGRLFYWDTISPSWNFFTDTTSIGAPHTLTNTGNKLRGIYGNKGGIYEGDKPFVSILNKMSSLNRNHTLEFYPSSLSGKENITLIAVSGNSTNGGASTNIRKGIYAFGAQEESLPDSFVYLYRMSSGNITDDNLKIGFVDTFGSDVYFSWKDAGGNFGVDKVAIDAAAETHSSSYSTLIFDAGDSKKQFLPIKVQASFAPLLTGESVYVEYNLDRGNETGTGTTVTVGESEAVVWINKRVREMAFGVVVVSTNGTFPKITELALFYDDLSEENIV